MAMLYRYIYAADGTLIGYHGWNDANKPAPDGEYVEQAAPAGMLTDGNGNHKYEKQNKDQKKWKVKGQPDPNITPRGNQ